MNMFEDLTRFETKDEDICYFVKTVKNNIMVWKKIRDRNDEYTCGVLDLSSVDEDILTSAGIWCKLSTAIKNKITEAQNQVREQNLNKMAQAHKHRKKKYDFSHLPDFLKCKCGREVKANYYYLQKKADEKKVPLDDLVKGYQCQKCNPTKGRRKKK